MKRSIRFTILAASMLFVLLAQRPALAQQAGGSDSTWAMISPIYDQVGPLHRFFLGDSYRQLYATPVKMRVMDLQKEHGGLRVVKLGGGMQTQSLRLADASGREWVLRSIDKYPERSLPENLRNTIAKDIVQDQISIAHPYGALTVPTLNRALGIPHVSPELVFVGDDPGLGEYRELFKNRAYMFEPRMPSEDEKTDNSEKVIRKLLEDNDARTEQRVTLRSRLLDFLLGDWDRHEDNFRWEKLKDDGETEYTVVPRDRDKVYYKTSGVLPTLLSYQWLKAHLQGYSPSIRNVSHWNFNQRHLDRFFLNAMDQKDWQKEILRVQQTLSDSLIHSAMLAMPDTIVRLSAGEIERNMRARRDSLYPLAMEYYKIISRDVDIPLSEKNEFVDIEIKKDGRVSVDVHNKKKDGSQGRRLYKRIFDPSYTREVRVYGLAGGDVYKLSAKGKSKIKVRIIGGKGYDVYRNKNIESKLSNVFLYEDRDSSKNDITPLLGVVRKRLRSDTAVHGYDYHNFQYDRKGVLLDLNYGVDRGLILGLGYLIENHGFRKDPFAVKHEFLASYLTGRKSFMVDYKGTYKDLIWGHDLRLEASSLGPGNQSNFFGYGNKTEHLKGKGRGIKYYRNRYDKVDLNVLLRKQLSPELRVYYGSSSEFYHSSSKSNKRRFLGDFDKAQQDEPVFGTKFFSGVMAGAQYDSRDEKDFPHSGIYAMAELSWQHELSHGFRQYSKMESSLTGYKTILDSTLTLANRTGVQAVWGSPFFYQHASIGGERSLRGYNSNRFTGKTAVYNNIDVRLKLFSFQAYVFPGTVGALGFYDIGRVWDTGEVSSRWHMGYGGGVYFNPAGLFTLQAVMGFSREAALPYIRLGMSF